VVQHDPIRRRSRPAPDETTEQALRRLLGRYLSQVRQAEPATAKGSVDGLHDLRVGLRKIRNVVLLFHDVDPSFLGKLDRRISNVSDRMGEARDLDVWAAIFRELDAAGGQGRISRRDRQAVEKGLKKQRDRLTAAALADPVYREVKAMVWAYIRTVPSRKSKKSPRGLAARQMLVVRDLIDARYRRVGGYSCNRAHQLRKAGRRMRYLAEFFAPDIGPVCVEATEVVTRVQSALGKVHDCDSALELSADLPTGKARTFVREALSSRRADYLHKFKTAWRQYADRRLQQAWQAQLEAASAS